MTKFAISAFNFLLFVFVNGQSDPYDESFIYGQFPAGFKWGAATAAYQIEGGWDADGKGLNVWDVFVREPGNIANNDTGDVACDSYNKFREDVQLLKALGLQAYRFSISWARVIPNGIGAVNPPGIQYYNDLIDELIANGIEPVVTLYHWDIPQALEDMGGWQNPSVADWFADYARVCYANYGDRVKQWITLNEPKQTAVDAYGTGINAPGVQGIGTITYVVAHNQILAHAKAYRVYETEFAASQGGQVGITINYGWAEPVDPNNQTHLDASERSLQFEAGWFAHPILVDGHYPPIMRSQIDAKSAAQGYNPSRLPTFTTQEAALVLNTSDFLGINYYTGNNVEPFDSDIADVSYYADSDTMTTQDSRLYKAASSWLTVYPESLRKSLAWAKARYGDIDIYITENGHSDFLGNLDDISRIYYYKHYLNEALQAINSDGVNLKGYFAWSLLDNFEWGMGYTVKFGIHQVDFNDPNRTRTQKASARYLASIVAANGFVNDPTGGPCSNS